jgi:hypothetical protein
MNTNNEISSRPKSLIEFFKAKYFWKVVLGVVLGGLAGFLIYYFVGCKTESCAVARNPYATVITGSVLGFIMTCSSCLEKGKLNS